MSRRRLLPATVVPMRRRTSALGARLAGCAIAALALWACAPEAEEAGRVHPDAASVRPLAPGARVPSATVRTVAGEPVDLAAAVRDRGALLVFYRGGW